MSELNTNTVETNANEVAAPEKVKLPLRERLVAKYNELFTKSQEITAKLNELASEINAIDALAAVGVGSEVFVSIGKGDTAKVVAGTVIGVKEEEDGTKLYKVTYGSGFDADVTVVKAGKLSLTAPVVEQAAEAVAAE